MVEHLVYPAGEGRQRAARYFRADRPGAPLVVALHGGAWRAGSPHRYDGIGAMFAARGVAVMAIEYTLVSDDPGTRFPAQMADLRRALDFVARSADTLGVDAGRIALMGDSAGATLAALYAQGGFRGDGPAIRAMVGIYGVYDLLAQFEHDLLHRSDDQITEALLGVSALDDRQAYQAASPLSHAVRRADAPASLIVWGDADDVVDCATQSEAYLSTLKRAGQRARGLPVAGAGHFWISEPLDLPHSRSGFAAPRILSFLRDTL